MHKVVMDINDGSKPAFRSEGDRDHAIKLIQMLVLKMDSISRTQLFKHYADEHGMHDYFEILGDAEKRDQAHIEWLKKQIRRSVE